MTATGVLRRGCLRSRHLLAGRAGGRTNVVSGQLYRRVSAPAGVRRHGWRLGSAGERPPYQA